MFRWGSYILVLCVFSDRAKKVLRRFVLRLFNVIFVRRYYPATRGYAFGTTINIILLCVILSGLSIFAMSSSDSVICVKTSCALS